MSIAGHRAKVSVISRWVSGSASRSAPSVSSEKTTPQPNVASGGLRSTIATLWVGSAFLSRIARYRPAGPAPMMRTFTRAPRRGASSRQHLRQPVQLRDVGDGREEDQLVAARLLVAAHEVADGARGGQVAGGDLLGERAGERVVVAQVVGAAILVAEGEVALAPEERFTGAAEVTPGGARAGGGALESARRAAAVGVAVGVAGHAREGG